MTAPLAERSLISFGVVYFYYDGRLIDRKVFDRTYKRKKIISDFFERHKTDGIRCTMYYELRRE